ncbi:MAG: hypothetical protein AB7T32_09855 [Dehalococcoidia bacterium]
MLPFLTDVALQGLDIHGPHRAAVFARSARTRSGSCGVASSVASDAKDLAFIFDKNLPMLAGKLVQQLGKLGCEFIEVDPSN